MVGVMVYFTERGVEMKGQVIRDLVTTLLIRMPSGSLYKRRPDQIYSAPRGRFA